MDKSAQDQTESGAGDNRKEANQPNHEDNRQGPYFVKPVAGGSASDSNAPREDKPSIPTSAEDRAKAEITPIRIDRERDVLTKTPDYTAATDASPQALDYRYARTASELLEAGMADSALDICQRGIKQFPDYAIGYQVLGDLYLEQEKTISATFAYMESLKREPDNPLTLMKLGDLYRREGHADESLRCYQDALRLEPNAPPVIQRLAALGEENIPIDGTPDSVLATETAANLFLEQGYKEKAKAIYLRLLRQSPENQELRKKLEQCN